MAGSSLNRGELAMGIPWRVDCKVERESFWNTVSTSSPVTYLPVYLPSLGGVLKSGLLPPYRVSGCIGRRVWSSPTLCFVCQVFTSCSSCSSSGLSSPWILHRWLCIQLDWETWEWLHGVATNSSCLVPRNLSVRPVTTTRFSPGVSHLLDLKMVGVSHVCISHGQQWFTHLADPVDVLYQITWPTCC